MNQKMNKNINRKKIIVICIIALCLIIFSNVKIKNGKIENTVEMNVDEEITENEIKENIIEENNKENEDKVLSNTNEIEAPKKEINEIKEKTPNKKRSFENNVAFIGDSRTQAFLMYAGLNDVIDYTNIGLMVDTAVTKKFIKGDKGEKITILEDMKKRNINTVYIMLGVNELGWKYSNVFIDKYEKLIDLIRQTKPNCEIIVQSIIPLTKTKSDNDDIYKNQRVREYNELLKKMSKEKNLKYIDIASVLSDNNGDLPEEASTDGIHLNKEYCLKWLDCLKKN